ncbi:MAG: Holliday junction branch migration protein RuvA [Pelovirga sp.]
MIALLTGQLMQRAPDQIIVDVGGVGYQLYIPLSTFYRLPETGRVCLQVFTNVKEDAITLFGFFTSAEKDLFSLLISVSGVGPRLGITILSHIAPEELTLALSQGDITRLTAIPGIGKKSAERLVLELQEKAGSYAISAAIVSPTLTTGTSEGHHQDAVSALVNLGYKESLARQTLKKLQLDPETPLEQILKAALQILLK